MILKFPKIEHFLQVSSDFSKKPRSIKTFYFYPSERPHYALSENSTFYEGWTKVQETSKGIKSTNLAAI